MAQQRIELAIVGLQHNHIYSVAAFARKNAGISLAAVVEPDPEKRQWAEKQWSVPTYAGLPQMLANHEIHAAALAPINAEKAPLAVQCMQAGLHVIVDKPIAVTWEQVNELKETAEQTGRVLTAMFTLRFDPVYATARRLYREGAIGPLVHAWLTRPHKLKRDQRPSWMFSRGSYGGIITDLAVHDLDFFRWLTGADQRNIDHMFALHGNYRPGGDPDFEDAAHIMLRLDDGTVAVVEANWFTPAASAVHGHCRAVLTGTTGTIEIDTWRNTVTLTTQQAGAATVALDDVTAVEHDFLTGIRHGVSAMVLPPADALESTAWTLLARDAADETGRYRRS